MFAEVLAVTVQVLLFQAKIEKLLIEVSLPVFYQFSIIFTMYSVYVI